MAEPRFFRSAREFGRWLAANHAEATEIWIGFYKKHARRPGMSYLEAVEEALCWGWIDTLVRSRDADSFQQRFTPRKSRSIWSLVNIARVERLTAAGRMRPPGLRAFEVRDAKRTGMYSFEQETVALVSSHRKRFQASPKAWAWFSAQGASYRRAAIHWINTAKQVPTRERRLAQLIADSGKGVKLRHLDWTAKRTR